MIQVSGAKCLGVARTSAFEVRGSWPVAAFPCSIQVLRPRPLPSRIAIRNSQSFSAADLKGGGPRYLMLTNLEIEEHTRPIRCPIR